MSVKIRQRLRLRAARLVLSIRAVTVVPSMLLRIRGSRRITRLGVSLGEGTVNKAGLACAKRLRPLVHQHRALVRGIM